MPEPAFRLTLPGVRGLLRPELGRARPPAATAPGRGRSVLPGSPVSSGRPGGRLGARSDSGGWPGAWCIPPAAALPSGQAPRVPVRGAGALGGAGAVGASGPVEGHRRLQASAGGERPPPARAQPRAPPAGPRPAAPALPLAPRVGTAAAPPPPGPGLRLPALTAPPDYSSRQPPRGTDLPAAAARRRHAPPPAVAHARGRQGMRGGGSAVIGGARREGGVAAAILGAGRRAAAGSGR